MFQKSEETNLVLAAAVKSSKSAAAERTEGDGFAVSACESKLSRQRLDPLNVSEVPEAHHHSGTIFLKALSTTIERAQYLLRRLA